MKKAMQWGRRDFHDKNGEEGKEAKMWVTYLAHTDAVGS
jgi:hypothetical protein